MLGTAGRATPRWLLLRCSALSTAAAATPLPQVVVLAGATAVGKSAVALRLAEMLGGEIVGADSVQLNRRLVIGANKPSARERAQVPHWVLDVKEPSELYTAGDWYRLTCATICDIHARGKVPIVTGGTSMYLDWFLHGKPYAPKSSRQAGDAGAGNAGAGNAGVGNVGAGKAGSGVAPGVAAGEARDIATLEACRASSDWPGGVAVLAARDPRRATEITKHDWYRLARAVEVSWSAAASGGGDVTFDDVRRKGRDTSATEGMDIRPFFLVGDRWSLNRRIDGRCGAMLVRGLVGETARLLLGGHLVPGTTAARAIGYQQVIEYLGEVMGADGGAGRGGSRTHACGGDRNHQRQKGGRRRDASAPPPVTLFSQFCAAFSAASRQYARRQLMWHRKDLAYHWVALGPQDRPAAAATDDRGSRNRDSVRGNTWGRDGGGGGGGGRGGRGHRYIGGNRDRGGGGAEGGRTGDGDGECGEVVTVEHASLQVATLMGLPRETFDKRQTTREAGSQGAFSCPLRVRNLEGAAGMKRYVTNWGGLLQDGDTEDQVGRDVREYVDSLRGR